jgi:predicted kinase
MIGMPRDIATLYCIYGNIAAGKTTLARKLAAQHGAVLLCEDEWLVRLEAEIDTFDDFRKHARRLRAAIGPLVIDLLRLGVPVVLDFPANMPNDRAWIRSLFEAAGAAHELHVIEAPYEVCRARLHVRNETKPEGLYFGFVAEDVFEPVMKLMSPPAEAEGFNIVRHQARPDQRA